MRDEPADPEKLRREMAWFFAGLGGVVAFIGWIHCADLRWANDPGNPDPWLMAAVYGADAAILISAAVGLRRRARWAVVMGTAVAALNLLSLVPWMVGLLGSHLGGHVFSGAFGWSMIFAGLGIGVRGTWGLVSRCRAYLCQGGSGGDVPRPSLPGSG